jgi:hypothetical protein
MRSEFLEELPSLAPLTFFSLSHDVSRCASFELFKKKRKNYSLPSTSLLLDEERFADLSLAWNEEGIMVAVVVEKPFEEAIYPEFERADALEFFLDTRDMKSAGFATRFCHQFLILPQAVQGVQAQELTRFRTEETHPLCDPSDIQIDSAFDKHSYEVYIMFPAHCLHGFAPSEFQRLGFTYRIHGKGRGPQHFAVSSDQFAIEQQPKLWASLALVKG